MLTAIQSQLSFPTLKVAIAERNTGSIESWVNNEINAAIKDRIVRPSKHHDNMVRNLNILFRDFSVLKGLIFFMVLLVNGV